MSDQYKILALENEQGLCDKLVVLRKRSGQTQQNAADGMGLTRASLNSYENGIRKPKIDAIKKMAAYYGVSVDYLLGEEDGTEPEYSPQTQILLQTLRGATEDEIAQAIKIIEALKK